MAIEEIYRDRCTNCALCYNVCPMDVLAKMGIYIYIAYPEDCMSCHLCEDVCPEYISMRRCIGKIAAISLDDVGVT